MYNFLKSEMYISEKNLENSLEFNLVPNRLGAKTHEPHFFAIILFLRCDNFDSGVNKVEV